MLSLDAKEWKNFEGGYKIVYDASTPLKILESLAQPIEKIWNELWENLYHQGDVGIASYAAVPQVYKIYYEKGWVDYQLPNFASAVEKARLCGRNPKLPEWLSQEYFDALQGILRYCLENTGKDLDKNFSRAVLLLTAVLMKDTATYRLLETVSVGDEEKLLEFYCDIFNLER